MATDDEEVDEGPFDNDEDDMEAVEKSADPQRRSRLLRRIRRRTARRFRRIPRRARSFRRSRRVSPSRRGRRVSPGRRVRRVLFGFNHIAPTLFIVHQKLLKWSSITEIFVK